LRCIGWAVLLLSACASHKPVLVHGRELETHYQELRASGRARVRTAANEHITVTVTDAIYVRAPGGGDVTVGHLIADCPEILEGIAEDATRCPLLAARDEWITLKSSSAGERVSRRDRVTALVGLAVFGLLVTATAVSGGDPTPTSSTSTVPLPGN
jgi:hypothetical protein